MTNENSYQYNYCEENNLNALQFNNLPACVANLLLNALLVSEMINLLCQHLAFLFLLLKQIK